MVAQLVKNPPAVELRRPQFMGSIHGLGRSAEEALGYPLQYSWAFLVVQLVKNLPAMWEAWIQSLGWEYPLEKGTVTHSQ